jgi:ABC-type antimicrobial peptide transport system permease subunit
VLGEASGLVLTGSVIGLVGTFAITKIEESEFHGVTGLDLTAFALSAGVLAAAMLIAGAVPAWRAANIDPIAVLRTE